MRKPTAPRRGAVKALAVAASIGTVALLGACGSSGGGTAQVTSIEEALGMDENAIQEREAKVQEEIRKCMEAEGFDYVPMDPSRLNIKVMAPGDGDNTEFRRTKGYGITTTFGEGTPLDEEGSTDPNQEIREALSDAEQEAYDKALFGAAAVREEGGGGFSVHISAGASAGAGEVNAAERAPDAAQMGCFGQAREKVGGNDDIERLGPKLQELQERIASDPRMVTANAAWAECMSEAGFDFVSPEGIPPYLFGKMQELQSSLGGGGDDGDDGTDGIGGGGGGGAIVIGPSSAEDMEALRDSPELAALQREELALARADDECSESTGRRETAQEVRAEAEERFLEENPNLASGGDETEG